MNNASSLFVITHSAKKVVSVIKPCLERPDFRDTVPWPYFRSTQDVMQLPEIEMA